MDTGGLGQWVDTILTGLFVVAGAIMIFFILLQEGKGGGLAALGGTKGAGVEGVTNPIRRATVYMAILFFVLAVILGVLHKPKKSLGIGSETASSTKATGAGNTKPAEAVPIETKPAEGTKTEAPKTGEAGKPAEGAKTEEKKPAEAAKTDAPEAAKTEEKKPVEVQKTEEKK